MSFGYSVGDFFAVVNFAYNVWERCKRASSEFKDMGRDVGNAHIVLKNIHAFWKSEEEAKRPLLPLQEEQLKEYTEYCEAPLGELEVMLQKYEGMDKSVKLKAKFVFQDFFKTFATIRENLQRSTGNLAIFHISLTGETLSRASSNQEKLLQDQAKIILDFSERAKILEYFIRSYREFQDGIRPEPAYSETAKSVGPDKQQTYDAAESELRNDGIELSAIKAHHLLIKEWIDTVILADTADPDEGNTENSSTVVADTASSSNWQQRVAIDDLYQSTEKTPDVSQASRTGTDGRNNGERKLSAPQNIDNRENKVNIAVRRTESMSSHRSQSSTWVAPEAENEKYATIMLAKVMRSKYSPEAGNQPFMLPIKRAFLKLDWTSRGWLLKDTVEESCIAAANLTGWTFDAALVTSFVMAEDNKNATPDHRIDFDEFYNIILTMREAIKVATTSSSAKKGLADSLVVLRKWYDKSTQLEMLSSQWRFMKVERRRDGGGSYVAHYYDHDIGGPLPDFKVPFNRDLTTAIYLAIVYGTSRVDAALRDWQSNIRQMSENERLEYIEALNNVLEVNPAFHRLEDKNRLGAFHSVDACHEEAGIVPVCYFDDLRDCPTLALQRLYTDSWKILEPVLGFSHDLGVTLVRMAGKGTPPPKLKRWRTLRMLDRSREIRDSVTKIDGLLQPLADVQEWYQSRRRSLLSRLESCMEETQRLRSSQEAEAELSFYTTVDMEVWLDKISHMPFRTPWVTLESTVDGNRGGYGDWATKSARPSWSQHLTIQSLADRVRLEFKQSAKGHGEKQPMGAVEFNCREVLDMKRMAEVRFSRNLQREGRAPSTVKAHISVTPRQDHNALQQFRKTKAKLSLAQKILEHPIPKPWEIQRNTPADGLFADRVYFINTETKQPTAMLWIDPLFNEATNGELRPLPEFWHRHVVDGVVKHKHIADESKILPQDADPSEPRTFQQILQPVLFGQD